MNININNDKTLKLYHDKLGNLYLEDNDEIHYVYIDSKNEINLEKLNKNKLVNNSTEYYYNGKMKNISSSLKKRIENEINLKKDKEQNEEYVDEESKYYEKSDILINNEYANECDIDPLFVFYNDDNEYIIEKGFDTDSLYSFLVIKGGYCSTENIMLSEPFNDTESYQIVFYTDGYAKLKIIGSCERKYKIDYDNNKIKFLEFFDYDY